MQTQIQNKIALALLALLTTNSQLLTARAQGTAFTYQGRLDSSGAPANGSYDLTLTLFNVVTNGNAIAGPITNTAVAVSNGLFTTTVDFGSSVWNGESNWLQIGVETNGAGSFTTLTPRQQLTPAPYAITAEKANQVAGLTVQQDAYFDTANMIGGSPVNYVYSGAVGATIAGGGSPDYDGNRDTNSVTADFGTVSGGADNTASGQYATVGGGDGNVASGAYATVPGGYFNIASGINSFAAGGFAQALHDGSFVWSDGDNSFASTAPDQFSVRATGGIRFAGDLEFSGGNAYHNLSLSGGNSTGFLYGSYPALGDGIHLGYNYYYDTSGNGHISNTGGATSRLTVGYGFVALYVGGVNAAPATQRLLANTTGVTVYGTFNNSSDRNAKQDFAPVSSSQILDKVVRLPLSEWSYKEDPKTRHVGPMGQDFYAAFDVGTDERHIAPIDEGGVALAAIQGLNQKVEDKDALIQQQAAAIAELQSRLERLEQIVLKQKSN